ncbi:hypothetical protein CYLTODRAFT_43012 [Cylindrobasidium torrendii FP15055 ss-10]|uniref:Uncharacterized protein n=1 Tax=Cylindrobasidium torrendii FP15055 ss-10 TaxID=1314674 RepID=A0A0D7B6B9_9AGAR|nr:hypothetical protein CYLTODRAFT_43012 [Cylindrobasidium torrendii FP15055 ss-10]
MSLLANFPSEILQEIFIQCCTETAKDMPLCCNYCLTIHPYSLDFAVPNQHALRQICRRWQTIVDGTSQLWSTIRISSMMYPPLALDLAESISRRFVRTALKRSGTALIDIQIDYHMWFFVSPVLIPEQHRWRSLLLGLLCIQRRPGTLTQVTPYFVPETSQETVFPWKIKNKAGDDTIPTFENAQALQRIRCGVALLASVVPLPWVQIVDLSVDFSVNEVERMHEAGKAQIVRTLSSAPALQRLGCTGYIPSAMPIITNRRITEFQCDKSDWLSLFNFPSLRSLTVDQTENICGFLDKSQPSLQTLDLGIANCSFLSSFKELLGKAPHLQKLRVHTHPARSMPRLEFNLIDVLDALLEHKTIGPGLPLLELSICQRETASDGRLTITQTSAALAKVIRQYPSLRRVALALNVQKSHKHEREWMNFQTLRELEELAALEAEAACNGVVLKVVVEIACHREGAREYRLV